LNLEIIIGQEKIIINFLDMGKCKQCGNESERYRLCVNCKKEWKENRLKSFEECNHEFKLDRLKNDIVCIKCKTSKYLL
jgi:hypothetical protein